MQAVTILLWITATSASAAEPVDFNTGVMPVLTKAGCNTGACHGAAVGRGGFRLSLYGGDPQFDYHSIVLELEGRRVNLARPNESLILLKATESISHGGGPRLAYDGARAKILEQWIGEGSLRRKQRTLRNFEVVPRSHILKEPGEKLVLQTTATFSDSSNQDVTSSTVFTPEDSAAVEVDATTAEAKLLRRGRHIVVARYLDRVVPIELIVPLSDQPVDLDSAPRRNFIDTEVLGLLKTLRIPISGQVDDVTFLRRVTLDLTGRLPTVEEAQQFAVPFEQTAGVESAKKKKGRRAALVSQLLASEQFNDYWTLKLARLLRIRSQPQDKQGALAWHSWLKTQLRERTPYDRMARLMLVSAGDSHEVGQANFYRAVGGARAQAEYVSELFLGSRLRCANCHNHPLDRWTQDDYHGLSAIFAKVQQGRVIRISPSGQVIHPRTGEAAAARIPGSHFLADSGDNRVALAKWLTNRDNPFFAKAIVNRLWKAMMGRGLVEPTDDFRDTNPATHPELLDRLARDFVEHDYDLRHTLKTIALSSSYARSSSTTAKNKADDRFYSHAIARPLEAEVLADAISDVTGLPETYGDEPEGTRAVTLFDPKISSQSLDILGRCSREDSCETASETVGGLARKLHLLNGPLLNRRIADKNGRLAKLLRQEKSPAKIVDEFYLRALGRDPSQKERAFWQRQLAISAGETKKALEDFLWALLTCREFATNH